MRDLTDRALDAATAAGASYADVRIERLERQVVSVKNGRPDGLVEDESVGFGVRVIVDGAWGFASSSRVEPREIERVARRGCGGGRWRGLRAGPWRSPAPAPWCWGSRSSLASRFGPLAATPRRSR